MFTPITSAVVLLRTTETLYGIITVYLNSIMFSVLPVNNGCND